jgi:hypothetical protein
LSRASDSRLSDVRNAKNGFSSDGGRHQVRLLDDAFIAVCPNMQQSRGKTLISSGVPTTASVLNRKEAKEKRKVALSPDDDSYLSWCAAGVIIKREAWKMSDPLGWPMWLQIPLLAALVAGAALEWFVTGYSGLLVIAFGLIVAVCLRRRYSN